MQVLSVDFLGFYFIASYLKNETFFLDVIYFSLPKLKQGH